MFLRKNWKILFGILVSIFFLWLALRGLDLERVAAYLRAADYRWIIPGIIVYFLAVWARTWRWHYLLRPIKPVPLHRLFPIVCIGYTPAMFIPRAGYPRSFYVALRASGQLRHHNYHRRV
jgi:uncharacterized membrane protein YbhN (UPF0104 family)